MYTLFVIIAIAVMLIAAVFLLSYLFRKEARQRQSENRQSATAAADQLTTQWRAVKIVPGLISCSAVQKLAYGKYLANDSPSLPLENCSQKECRCKYVHLDDRRSGGDRRVELGELDNFLPANLTERRSIIGRRAADMAA